MSLAVLILTAYAVVDKIKHRHEREERRRHKPEHTDTKIHSIFRPANLQTYRDCATAMRPALRLASRLLATDHLLGFWYTVFFSDTIEIRTPEDAKAGTRHFMYTDAPRKLTHDQIRRTNHVLKLLADCVTFDLESKQPRYGGGRCKHLRQQRAALHLQGHKSEIQISSYFYDSLTNSAISEADKVWLQFELAKTLLHELAHAAVNAARGRESNHYYFFPGCNVAEDGFQLEAELFGGKIDLDREEFKAGLRKGEQGRSGKPLIRGFRRAWPCQGVVEEYLARGSSIGVRGPVARRRRTEEVDYVAVSRLLCPSGG
ncbi:hypothetical protein LTR78_001952 [Recurvomyces mirabilis]|uniref:Uncharacterized protein n=1 Tax=Recurvomyces mirabilis TaxID=574656 RepID=A0AAE0WU39_9PEZI|nr:hypothetical protein LTR78_001952 [Recurvomyces mirabilis]KAK5160410.1 hypothetical protein LTS14_001422 [Recurvomyces mirabilis]